MEEEVIVPAQCAERPALGCALAARWSELLSSALAHASVHSGADAAVRVESVRRIRKATKALRASLPLLTEAAPAESLSGADRMLSDASRQLSSSRDRDAMLETIDRLIGHRDDVRAARVRELLTTVVLPDDSEDRAPALEDLLVGRAADMLRRLTKASERFEFGNITTECVGSSMLACWRRVRRDFRADIQEADVESAHELRKRCGRLALQIACVEDRGGKPLKRLRRSLRGVTSALGEEHDLALLAERVSLERARFASDDFVETALTLCTRARARLRERASDAVAVILAVRTKAFRGSLGDAIR